MSLSRPTTQSQAGALLAIARKDVLLMGRYPLQIVARIVQPLVWLTPIYFLGQAFSDRGRAAGFEALTGTSDYFSYIVLGSVLSSFVASVFWGMGYSLKLEMDAGTLESNWLAPAPRLTLLAGRTIASMAMTLVTSLGVLAIAWLVFGVRVTGNVLGAVGAIVPAIVGLYGFGFAFAGAVLLLRDANTLVDVSSYVVEIVSGAMYPVTVLPWFVLPVALALPLTYGYDAVRGLLLGTRTLLPLAAEIAILVVFMVVMLYVGARTFAAIERRVRVRGTLGQH